MANLTSHYNFKLPLNTERASQIPFNENFQILDEKLYECALKTSLSETNNKLSSLTSAVNSNYSEFTTFQGNVEGNYYTSSEIDNLLDSYAKTSDLSIYAKTSELSIYAKTSDLSEYVTTTTFTQNINNLNSVYVSKTNLSTEIANLNLYVTKSELSGYATTSALSSLEIRVKALEDVKTA